ncbi:hypothetical protein DY000_02035526 [Brassica cretica]|uniref:Uncharacterized protein n=1 Tax=Brassica cretica TaxID=69181 RepID=A0ABQ7DD72_BRACR|nr:hypothetical protein DY000_02035526 [Brassica cretica]
MDLRLDENKVDVDLVIFVTAPRSPSLVPRSPGPRGLRLELVCLMWALVLYGPHL